MRHPRFKPEIFTALIKNRNFRPLSHVLASMPSYLFHKKRIDSFCLFFLCLIKIVGCFVFAVFLLETIFILLVIWGQSGIEPGTSRPKIENHSSIPLSHAVSHDAFLPFFTNRDFSFIVSFSSY